MSRATMNNIAFLASALVVALLLVMIFGPIRPARSQPVEYPCPANAKSCKIITLTPDEEASLVGPEMIFDHALWGARVRFDGIVQAWRDKIRNAPAGKATAGKVVAPTPPPAPPTK